MSTQIRLILLSFLFFSCDTSIVTDNQKKEYNIHQDILRKNKTLLLAVSETCNKTALLNDLVKLPLDSFILKNKIEPSKTIDFLSSLSGLTGLFENAPRLDSAENKLLISKTQECFEILDISIQTGFSFNVSKIDTTKITKSGNDTIILK